MDESTNGRRGGADARAEVLDLGPYLSDWLRSSPIRIARAEMRLEESALVFASEGDRRAGDR
jgi:hypothetical protein